MGYNTLWVFLFIGIKEKCMTKIILIDSNSLINRAFYALPMLQNSSGQFTGAVYGYISMLQRLISEEKPTHICAIFDAKRKTFRNDLYAGYKAKRKGMPEELATQMPILKDLLETMGIKILSLEGFEGDDIIGTIAKRFKEDTIVVSGDKDCLQLVDDTTRVYNTRRGVSDVKVYNLEALAEEGLTPQQVIEHKGLAGDASDSIPGAPGVGNITARRLLEKYGSIGNVYENIEEIPGKLKDRLADNKDLVYLSKLLATIDTNVPIECSIDDMKFNYPLSSAVIEKMQELEFRNLIGRFEYNDGAQAVEIEKPATEIEIIEIKDIKELETLTNSINKGEKIVINWGDEVVIAFLMKEYHIPISNDLFGEGISPDDVAETISKLYSKDYKNIFFDAKTQKHILTNLSINVEMPYEDIQLKAYLINSSRTVNDEKELADIYCPHESSSAYAMLATNEILDKKIIEWELSSLYYDIELPLVECLFDMEKAGFKIDIQMLDNLSSQYETEINLLEKRIYELADEEFNIDSNKQLAEILFVKLQLPTKKKTKTGFSVSASVLEELDHPIVKSLLRYRQIKKLKSTYIDGMKAVMNKISGKVHTCFKQSLTTTGRLSSTEPNLQNIPIRRAEGREIRRMFMASKGCEIVTADYSQIELRLLAHFSEDKHLIDAYKHSEDIHSLTASKIYGVELDEVTEEMRSDSKAVNFGIIYGISSFGLANNLSVSPAKAKKYIDEYFKTYPSVKEYMDSNVKKAEKDGFLRTFKGRIRHFAEFKSPNHTVRAFAKRAAMNMPLQGSASDIIKIAMLRVWEKLKTNDYKAKLILQVHDELIIDAPINELGDIKKLIKEEMENAVKLSIPLLVNVSTGKNWFEAN